MNDSYFKSVEVTHNNTTNNLQRLIAQPNNTAAFMIKIFSLNLQFFGNVTSNFLFVHPQRQMH